MKSLRTLLKLAKSELETLRRALAEFVARQGITKERIRALEQSVQAEQQAAMRDYKSQRMYGGFAALTLASKRALEAELQIVDDQVDRLRDLIGEAHVEVRKFERLIELEAERAKKLRDRREAAELDEFATLQSGRLTRR